MSGGHGSARFLCRFNAVPRARFCPVRLSAACRPGALHSSHASGNARSLRRRVPKLIELLSPSRPCPPGGRRRTLCVQSIALMPVRWQRRLTPRPRRTWACQARSTRLSCHRSTTIAGPRGMGAAPAARVGRLSVQTTGSILTWHRGSPVADSQATSTFGDKALCRPHDTLSRRTSREPARAITPPHRVRSPTGWDARFRRRAVRRCARGLRPVSDTPGSGR